MPSSGINAITGRNMSGKSALLRALRLILFNKPDGKNFVTWGAKNAEVEIEYEGHTLTRIKGAKNIYVLDGSEFARFGKDIPSEVKQILGFEPVSVESKSYELNIADPHEAPFLVSESDTTKGRLLSSLGTHIVGDLVHLDKTIQRSNTSLRKMNAETEVLKSQLEDTDTDLLIFTPLDGIEANVTKCREEIAAATETFSLITRMQTFEKSLATIGVQTTFCNRVLEVCDVAEQDTQLVQIEGLYDHLESLTSHKSALSEIDIAVENANRQLDALEEPPENAVKVATELADELDKLYSMLERVVEIDQQVGEATKRIASIATELSQEVLKYKELLLNNGKCPICLREMEQTDLESIVEELVGAKSS
jgi:DNA repair exonuclease SbcCD ATPase subunit